MINKSSELTRRYSSLPVYSLLQDYAFLNSYFIMGQPWSFLFSSLRDGDLGIGV